MSSPIDAASLPEPLPAHLKALLELNREAETGLGGRDYWRAYSSFWILTALYGYIAWHSHEAAVLFFGILVLVFTLDGINQRRAQRRLQLLLTVIRSLQRRDDTAAHT